MPESLTIPNFEVSKINTVTVDMTKPASSKTIQENFEKFHALNPRVYELLVDMTRNLLARGHKMVGIGMLFEVLRWKYMMTTTDPGSEFKLCNNYRSRYARLIMRQEVDLANCFTTRDLRTL